MSRWALSPSWLHQTQCCVFVAMYCLPATLNLSLSLQLGSPRQDEYQGDLTDFDSLYAWAREHCIPMVREITFQNGEELTEEGLPLLIFFYHPDHPETREHFKQRVNEELSEEKGMGRRRRNGGGG